MSRGCVCIGHCVSAFGAGLLVATLFPQKLMLIVVAAILVLVGITANNHR